MAKVVKKKTGKKRGKYDTSKASFSGTFEDMIAISVTGAGARPKKASKKK